MKNNKGITLIALVVTIIVLLILAGVSIAMLSGDNGILTNAKNAKEQSSAKNLEEMTKLVVGDYLTTKKGWEALTESDATQLAKDINKIGGSNVNASATFTAAVASTSPAYFKITDSVSNTTVYLNAESGAVTSEVPTLTE